MNNCSCTYGSDFGGAEIIKVMDSEAFPPPRSAADIGGDFGDGGVQDDGLETRREPRRDAALITEPGNQIDTDRALHLPQFEEAIDGGEEVVTVAAGLVHIVAIEPDGCKHVGSILDQIRLHDVGRPSPDLWIVSGCTIVHSSESRPDLHVLMVEREVLELSQRDAMAGLTMLAPVQNRSCHLRWEHENLILFNLGAVLLVGSVSSEGEL